MSERRNMTISVPIEIRAAEDGTPEEFHGVIPYNSQSHDLGYFVEVVRPGAFRKTVQESDIRCVWYHQSALVLGRSRAGTLRFEDRDDGLHFYCKIPDRSYARDLEDLIQTGDVDGVSFQFRAIKDSWDWNQEPVLRELLEVQLIEVSLGVTWQAYPGASADLRSIESPVGVSLENLGQVLLKAKNPKAVGTITDEDKRALDRADAVIAEARAVLTGPAEEEEGAEPPDAEEHSQEETEPRMTLTQLDDELRKIELEILGE